MCDKDKKKGKKGKRKKGKESWRKRVERLANRAFVKVGSMAWDVWIHVYSYRLPGLWLWL